MTALGGMRSTRRGRALRRYPALAYLVAAGALALVLPSGLNVLQSGPTTLAEHAPVPGEGKGSSDAADLAQVAPRGIGASAGGAGAGGVSPSTTGPVPGDGSGGRITRKPGTKRCVGTPPRQTEDPLSPPCIAFFEGDNFGATAPGVTGDEVVVLLRLTSGASTQEEPIVDCEPPPAEDETFIEHQCKAFQRYFNDRYQTYERKVHFYSLNDEASVTDAMARYRPFAVAGIGAGSESIPRSGVMAFTYTGHERAKGQRHAPYLMSFRADVDDQIAQTATYICDRLVGARARFAGDPALTARDRKFGFLYWDGARRRKEQLAAGIEAACGVRITVESPEFDSPAGPAMLARDGVTTVILVVGNTGHVTATNGATAIGYFPEWFVPGAPDLNGIDINFHARLANSAQWANAFGLTFDIRRSAINEQRWYRAYREACPECVEPAGATGGGLFAAANYESLAMLFYGIQSAGPRLTPANVDKGLHAIPPRASRDPFSPAAYFAPGNYSFVKDAMAIWWDPTGQPPGSSARGCYRLPEDGLRHRAGEWPSGDALVDAPGPCQADTFQ